MGKSIKSPLKQNNLERSDGVNFHSLVKHDISKSHRYRKEKRKEKRQLKKLRRLAFSQKKTIPTQEDLDKAKQKALSEMKKKEKIRRSNLRKRAKKKMKKIAKQKEAALKREQHLKAIEKEDRELHHLEKQLKLKKSMHTLPKAFISDGLDFLLDVVDSEKLDIAREQNFEETMLESDNEDAELPSLASDENESESDLSDSNEYEIDEETKKNTKLNEQNKYSNKSILKAEHGKEKEDKKVKFHNVEDSNDDETSSEADDNSDNEDDNEVSDEDNVIDDDSMDDDCDNEEEENIDDRTDDYMREKKKSLSEDIYGRIRDEKGNVIPVSKMSGAYIPPAKRRPVTEDSDKRKQVLERLKKQMKGLINRTSESNIQGISMQIEDIYMSNSRADVNETLTSLIQEACVSVSLTPERLTMELVMLITLLHSNVGNEVGAFFIQNLAQKFDELYKQAGYGGDKTIDNIVMLFTGLYNFKVIRSTLLFDILKRFVDSFQEKDIELILLILKGSGFTLRKDDPSALKAIIIDIQTKASSADITTFADQSRVKFMLDILLAIKNNNMRKIPNFNPDHLEHLKKLTRNYIRGSGFADNQLDISLDDLLQAEEKGRWWLIGSAWEGRDSETKITQTGSVASSGSPSKASTKLLNLARKMRMNTDIRKNIFCVIMTSEDFLDAFEKLLRLGLKQKQEREIINVIQDCCLQEKKFNPFYAILTNKFCEHDHRFQITFQFSLWDKFKEMGNLSEHNRENLARLVSYLIVNKGISLSVLKVVEFGTLSKAMVQFLKHTLRDILKHSESMVEAAFLRIASTEKLRHLQDGLKLFMQHFLLKQKLKSENSEDYDLKEKVKLAEKVLSAGHTKLLL